MDKMILNFAQKIKQTRVASKALKEDSQQRLNQLFK